MTDARKQATVIAADSIYSPSGACKGKRYVLIIDGIIADISERLPVCRGTHYLDFTGLVLSPFFCDYHLHFPERAVASSGRITELLLQNGINTVFEGGDRQLSGIRMERLLHDRITVRTSGCAIYKNGTYGRFIGTGVADFSEARALIEQLCERGVNYIKIINSGIFKPESGAISEGGFGRKELAAIISCAKEKGLDVFCHANGAERIHDAVLAGAAAIVHGLYISSETFAIMTEKRIAFIPTINAFSGLCTMLKKGESHGERAVAGHLSAVKEAADSGIKVLAGSDSGPRALPYGTAYQEELKLFRRAGLSEAQILSSAVADQFSTGMKADFLVLKGMEIEKIFIRGECVTGVHDSR